MGTDVDVAAATTEIAASLTLEEIPVKLRCSICNMLALDAWRMPCCDQNVCETCQKSLEDECRVCLHTPVAKDLCKPNKTLRTTIKAFLKKKLMEKETQRKKEAMRAASTAALPTPSETVTVNAIQPSLENGSSELNGDTVARQGSYEPQQEVSVEHVPGAQEEVQALSDAQVDAPRSSTEVVSEIVLDSLSGQKVKDSRLEITNEHGVGGSFIQPGGIGELQHQNGQWPTFSGVGPTMNGAFGFNNVGGGMNMDFGQMMQLMPNGIPNGMPNTISNNVMGTFPNMMGMQGMGMDHLAITQAMQQSMFGGFGGPGMGMNGMNMTMGMGFNAGQGGFGSFNGQADAWNQDNYNANAYGANGMVGNFGTHAGYNMPPHQGNYNQVHHQQYQNIELQNGHNNHGFQNRGRGRRGGYYGAGRGRDNYSHMNQGNQYGHANHEPFHHRMPLPMEQTKMQEPHTDQQDSNHKDEHVPPQAKEDEISDKSEALQTAEERMNQELNPGDEEDKADAEPPPPAEADVDEQANKAEVASEPMNTSEQPGETANSGDQEVIKTLPIQTFMSSDDAPRGRIITEELVISPAMEMPPPSGLNVPLGPASQYHPEYPQDQVGWSRGAGRGSYRGVGAGRGEYRGRGGYFPNGNTSSHVQPVLSPSPTRVPVEPKGLGVEGAPTGPKALREGLPNNSLRGRGFSIVGRASHTIPPKSDERKYSQSPSPPRQRSRSPTPDSSKYRSVHQRSHRHRSRSLSNEAERDRHSDRQRYRTHKYRDGESGIQDQEDIRKRDNSPESSAKRPTHRSHRHHDEDSRSVSHRHNRDRSRDRERDEDRRHRRRRSCSPTAIVPTPTSPAFPEFSTNHTKDSSRKRRERERDDYDRSHDRKRSRRDPSFSPTENYQSSQRKTCDRDEGRRSIHGQNSSSSRKASITEKPADKAPPTKAIPTGPKAAEKDHHTLEREARNRERLAKEMQRRAATEGGAVKRRDSGLDGRIGGRRASYKYEDEDKETMRAARVESEREAARWA